MKYCPNQQIPKQRTAECRPEDEYIAPYPLDTSCDETELDQAAEKMIAEIEKALGDLATS